MKISEAERQKVAAEMRATEAAKSPEQKAEEAADIAEIQAETAARIARVRAGGGVHASATGGISRLV